MAKTTGFFSGKTVLVTGASSGIGLATARAFARAGARLVLVARRPQPLAAAAREVRALGADALGVRGDVADRDSVEACFARAEQRFGPVEVVVNNAGVMIPGRVETLRDRDLEAMLRVNLYGALHVLQSATRRMRERSTGHIVNVASLAGRRGISPIGGYSASKFALVGLTEALRVELAGSGVQVSLVMPGVVATPMAEAFQSAEDGDLWPQALNLKPEWVAWAVLAAVRLRLVEVAVPPGAATLEKLAALVPGLTDGVLGLATRVRKGKRP
jgi:NAD(P)-dependent dehydrogenase (short-subunit alcohol dehydrogenase family)